MPEASLREALKGLTVQQLKGLIRRLREPHPRGPKAELVDFLHGRLKCKSLIEGLCAS